ncbi:MAG: LemA family protein [Methylotenera sp.]|nr:LemA family protein [Methylotenera sp.]
MDTILGFIGSLFTFLVFTAVVIAVIAFWGYNTLRSLSENIREGWSNIGVVAKKQVSLINQLQDVVKGYQESEKLVMLKVSSDVSSANQLAQLHQQSSMVLSAVGSMAQKFPELKANEQYQRIIDSIQTCEAQLESARQKYNAAVKAYNVKRSSIPHVLYASTLGFKNAPYLEFDGETPLLEVGAMKTFVSDDDGERLNILLGQAGNKLLAAGNKAFEGSKQIAEAAHEKIKQIQETKNSTDTTQENVMSASTCSACSATIVIDSAFCNHCGEKLSI